MDLQQFPTPLGVTTIGSTYVAMGKFKPQESMELSFLITAIYKHGILGGSETLIMRLHTSPNLANVYCQSSPASVAEWLNEIESKNDSNYHYGYMRMDFDRQNLSKNQYYWVSLLANNYTEDVNNSYLAFVHDYPFTVNDPVDSPNYHTEHSGVFLPFGYR